jgi:hypothetical protein
MPRNNFGYHLDGAGDVNGDGYGDAIVSAPGVDPNNFEFRNAGQALLYLGSADGLSPAPAWIQNGDQDNMTLEAACGVGDVNGDGADDVATGSLHRDGAFVDAGRAYLFLGCPDVRADVAGEPSPRIGLAVGPNPFTHATTVRFRAAEPGFARLLVHDLQGRLVATLFSGGIERGTRAISWNGLSPARGVVAPGVYVMTLVTPGDRRDIKVVKLN